MGDTKFHLGLSKISTSDNNPYFDWLEFAFKTTIPISISGDYENLGGMNKLLEAVEAFYDDRKAGERIIGRGKRTSYRIGGETRKCAVSMTSGI